MKSAFEAISALGHPRLTWLPQSPEFAWLRPKLLNPLNYIQAGRLSHLGARAKGVTPLALPDWLPHIRGQTPTHFEALVGDPVAKSQGDRFHRVQALSLPATCHTSYLKIPVKKEDITHALPWLSNLGIRHLSVTSPHKTRAASLAHKHHAVNTLRWDGDRWEACDTDACGMLATLHDLEASGLPPGEVTVFGRGGVSQALLRAIKDSRWTLGAHLSARAGWPKGLDHAYLVVNASGDHDLAYTHAPSAQAWVDLHYTGVHPQPGRRAPQKRGALFCRPSPGPTCLLAPDSAPPLPPYPRPRPMRGNTFGRFLTLTTFGESHGPALGAVLDGVPAGIPLSQDDFRAPLARRRPGQSALTTGRKEEDEPQILSGVFEGKTLGSPVCVVVFNADARSQDYDPTYFRAGHADRVWQEKYGRRDWRGGGRASGRETLARVIGGVMATKILGPGVKITGFVRQIGTLVAQDVPHELDQAQVDRHPTRCPDPAVAALMEQELLECKAQGDSRGGVAELWIDGLPMGLGEPVFYKAKSELAQSLMSVGAVVGVTLGDAVAAASMPGKAFHQGVSGQGSEAGLSPAASGIQGGITNGQRIVVQVMFKPASTVGSMATSGRHDPCILPRAIPVLEAMAALTLANLLLAHKLDQM